MEQARFNFTRGDQLGLLKDLCIPDAPGIKGATAKSVLRAIDDLGVRCYAAAVTLARHTGLGLRTVRRALARVEELGLVVPDDRKQKNPNGSVTLTRRIDWTEIENIVRRQKLSTSSQPTPAAEVRSQASTSSRADHHIATSAAINGATMALCPIEHGATVSEHGAMVSEHGAMVTEHGATVAPNPQYPQRTATTRNVHAREAAADSWNLVIDRLRSVGLERVQSAIAIAIERNLSPEETLAIIDQFSANRSRFHSVGALLDRLRSGDWCQALPTPDTRRAIDHQKQAKRSEQDRFRIECQLAREWQSQKIWHLKSTAEINAEIERRMAMLKPTHQQPTHQQPQPN